MRAADLVAQAFRMIQDAVDAQGADEGWLLANDPDNLWCRVLPARDNLRVALTAMAVPPEPDWWDEDRRAEREWEEHTS